MLLTEPAAGTKTVCRVPLERIIPIARSPTAGTNVEPGVQALDVPVGASQVDNSDESSTACLNSSRGTNRPRLQVVRICQSCGRENPVGFEFCGFCRAPLAASELAIDVRKTVTVVFSDVTGSTSLGEQPFKRPLAGPSLPLNAYPQGSEPSVVELPTRGTCVVYAEQNRRITRVAQAGRTSLARLATARLVLDGGLTRLGVPPRRAADDKNSASRIS